MNGTILSIGTLAAAFVLVIIVVVIVTTLALAVGAYEFFTKRLPNGQKRTPKSQPERVGRPRDR